MRKQLTTRAQVSGYRFILRRMDHALLRRDPRMISDPMASQSRSLVVGLILALVITGGCGVLALLRPQGAVGDAKIVLAKESGALYVRVEDVLHPVTGLASARLVVGEAAQPTSVKDKRLSDFRRGPEVGIVGAPAQILGPVSAWTEGAAPWLLCDRTRPAPSDKPTARDSLDTMVSSVDEGTADDGAVLVRRGADYFLLFRGVRAAVNPSDPVVRRVAGIDGAAARAVSAPLLNAFEPIDPVAVPQIPGRGQPSSVVPGARVGDVVRVSDSDRDRLYVVLADGVQPVGAWAADLIRAGDPAGSAIGTAPASAVAAAATRRSVPVADLPDRRPAVRAVRDAPVICAAASTDGAGGGTVELRTFRASPGPGAPVALAGADGAGDALDAAAIPSGSGEYVVAAEPGGERRDGLFYISDSGVRYGIPNAETAQILGLQHKPRPVAWSVLAAIPAGPDLTRAAASMTRDGTPVTVSR
ncbi:type VII secretion protein EccB [Tsukamurella paurometabola]|uniref:Type VII secretion system protein eccB1 n=1 Tax=Tsukamurella paurometabola TaxID=2061 RepID=A0A3P8MDZ7_TSUPA|nr:type VII secretion protein EccB [Tsukamurella paurometabola]UEA82345.1 type VII secretion protein EccB [Tsukamurella paurometabola]VDR39393.1 Type VII secretion system protein eccB1 [Tsukamurella paurometabola]